MHIGLSLTIVNYPNHCRVGENYKEEENSDSNEYLAPLTSSNQIKMQKLVNFFLM